VAKKMVADRELEIDVLKGSRDKNAQVRRCGRREENFDPNSAVRILWILTLWRLRWLREHP
jgi:hypothetical protein